MSGPAVVVGDRPDVELDPVFGAVLAVADQLGAEPAAARRSARMRSSVARSVFGPWRIRRVLPMDLPGLIARHPRERVVHVDDARPGHVDRLGLADQDDVVGLLYRRAQDRRGGAAGESPAERDLRHDRRGEVTEGRDIFVFPGPRRVVDDAEGSDGLALAGEQGDSQVGRHPRVGDRRIAHDLGMQASVPDNQGPPPGDHEPAELRTTGGSHPEAPRVRAAPRHS